MRLVPVRRETGNTAAGELETIGLSSEHLRYLGEISHEMNPEMPVSIGLPHLIRSILEGFERSGIDLTEAGNEEEIARLALDRLQGYSTHRC